MENDITWEISNDILEEDIDERYVSYEANGVDKFGKKYTGSAQFVCGEFEGIKDIEQL